MITSLPAMGAVGGFGAATHDDEIGTVADLEEYEQVSEGETATVDDSVTEADGTVEVVVRVEEIDPSLLERNHEPEGVVADLQSHATETQEPILDYAERTDGVDVINTFWLTNAVVLELDTEAADVQTLASMRGVTDVHENFEVETPEPVDADGDVDADEYDTTYGLEQINAPDVWDEYNTMGAGAEIAVLDTGVDADHPDIDIDPENWAQFDGDGEEVDTEPNDGAGHGTHVSGTATGGNASGEYIGVAPDATLIHGKVLEDDGSGTFAQIIGGMEWAVDDTDADLISMSLGADGYHGDMIDPVRNAHDAGVTVVSSSGNSYEGSSGSPANVYESFAIGASDENENIAGFSSGEEIVTDEAWSDPPSEWPDEYVVPNVAAPGVDVKSSVPGGGYDDTYSGTSMAAPHVSGAMALMIAASGGSAEHDQITSVLEETAWKPDGEDDEQDTRYGHGIIDVKTATDMVAADSGIEGTVTDEDGEPIEGATVEVDGFSTTTDEDGYYELTLIDGEYDVTADAFGQEAATETVTVEEEEVTTQDFELDPGLDAVVLEDQPGDVEAGDEIEVVAEVANLESATIDWNGDYDGELGLEVNGDDAEFGEAVEFDEPYSGEVTVTVTTDDAGEMNVNLDHHLEGLGDELEVATGPTYVVGDPVQVGVVDTPGSSFGGEIADALDDATHPMFWYEVVETDDLMDAVDDDEYDIYVVQNFGDDEELVEDFVDETSDPQTGVVLLDQYGEDSHAIPAKAAATGDPGSTGFVDGLAGDSVYYTAETDHALLDGVADADETVELYNPDPVLFFGGFHSYFEDYDGHINAVDVAAVGNSPTGTTSSGTGLAADEFSSTVLASSLGADALVGTDDFTGDAEQILANSMEFVADAPPVVPLEDQPDQIEPGESIEMTVSAEQLEKVKVDVNEESTIGEDDLTLYVDGTINAFGEWRAYDPPHDGEYEIEVAVDEDAIGAVSLDHTFRTVTGDDGDEETTLTTGPTAVYVPPLEVGDDADVGNLTEAVDLIEQGGEIVVNDGTYYEGDTDTGVVGASAGVVVDTHGVSIEAAENANPTVLYDGDGFSGEVIHVSADDVDVDGLTVNVDDGEAHEAIFHGIALRGGVSDFTATDVTAGGVTGIFFDENVEGAHIEGVTGIDASTIVGTDIAGGGPTSDVHIEGVTTEGTTDFGFAGINMYSSDNLTVVDNEITDLPFEGIYLDGSSNVHVGNNTLVDNDDGIEASWLQGETVVENNHVEGGEAGILADSILDNPITIEDNHVENASTGLLVDDGPVLTAEHNTFDAETGVKFDAYGDFDATSVDSIAYNDFADTDVAFNATTSVVEGIGSDGAAIDARTNYVGDRTGSDDIALVNGDVGDVVYQPFLTESPAEVDHEETTEIATDLHLEAGETYGVGVPGPSDTSVTEMFDDDFEGIAYGFDAEQQSWEMLTAGDTVDSLNAMYVVAETDTRLTLDFQSPDGAPPGPAQYTFEEGWNFVTAPQYTDAETAFDVGSFEPGMMTEFADAPDGQLGPEGDLEGTYVFDGDGEDAPNLSAFEGYFVYSEEEGTMPAHLVADPTTDELYDRLDVDDQFAEDGDYDSVDDVLDAVDDADSVDRNAIYSELVSAAYTEIEGDLADVPAESTPEAINQSAWEIIDETPDEHAELVEDATEEAVKLLIEEELDRHVAGDDADETDTVIEETANAENAPAIPIAG